MPRPLRSFASFASGPVLLVAAGSGCAPDAPPLAPIAPPVALAHPPESPPPAPRDDGRLPPLAEPLRYALSLDIDPNKPRFAGSVRILVRVPASTSYIVLSGRGLAVHDADAQVALERVHASVTARNAAGGHDPEELVLTFDRPLPVGEAVLELAYDAPFEPSLAGLYRVEDGGRWYAFSQFEATDARRAFPCFDEPGFKVPFDVSITTPTGLLAVSNMPETGRAASGDRTRFDFQTSPPLPSYLVAFAVGDFDVREGQATPFPIRLVTTKGKAGGGATALDDTAKLSAELAGYFHIAYPYPKLDIVAVPNFAAGAMENAGLITFREEALLLDAHPPRDARIGVATTIAHELAHQWFGDLVTMRWWDDLWLNEGFATWAEVKIVQRWKPEFQEAESANAALGSLMAVDSLHSARAVRQPVKTSAEADEAFDRLTYEKGAAVLRMVESALGSEAFQHGVEAYLRDHAWKNATADDLLRALGEAGKTDVAALAGSFLDRPGVPVVTFDVDCKSTPAKLALSQDAWLPLGETHAESPRPWRVPVEVTTPYGTWKTLLDGHSGSLAVGKCPEWVDPSAGGLGYYRYALGEKGWTALAGALPKLDIAARLGFVANAWAGVKSGTLAPATLLLLLPALDGDPSRVVVEAEIEVLHGLSHALVSDAARPAFARYVAARLARQDARFAINTLAPPPDAALLRRDLFAAEGELAEDPKTLAEADKLATAWLADAASVDGDLARVALPLASRHAGPARIDALREALKNGKTPNDRKTALLAFGGFSDPATLDRALDVTLTGEVFSQDVLDVLEEATAHRATRLAAFDWLTRHWDAVRAKLPSFFAGYAFGLAKLACGKDEEVKVAAFFGPRADGVEGAKRPWDEAREAVARCSALREYGAAKVERFFQVVRK